MYAHVSTYRLGTSDEVETDLEWTAEHGGLSDQSARTIASWWHSPAATCRNITALSHGLPFDTDELAEEIQREITDDRHAVALLGWLDTLEAHLSDEVVDIRRAGA